MTDDPSLLIALIAGLLSFLSPCVLPLIPSYLSFLSGTEADELAAPRHRRMIRSTLCFILGFTVVFVLFSILFTGPLLLFPQAARVINLLSGAIILLFGLNMLFDFIPSLNYEKRFHPKRPPRHLLDSLVAGLAFGAGWSPCIGPILGSILLLAGHSGTLGRSILYLSAYSLGLALPFLLAAILWRTFLRWLGRIRPFLPIIRIVSALLLVGIGISIALGAYRLWNSVFVQAAFALDAWAKANPGGSRFLPGGILLAVGLLPVIIRRARRKNILHPAPLIFSIAFCTLGLAQAMDLIDTLALVSQWLSFQGI
jgi:cytochrome c-type biogenesis protein